MHMATLNHCQGNLSCLSTDRSVTLHLSVFLTTVNRTTLGSKQEQTTVSKQDCVPSKHAGSDSEAFWLWPESGRTILAGSDFQYLIQLHSAKEYHAILAQIRSGGPAQVLAKCVGSRSKPVSINHQAWFWQNATGPLPVSHFQTWLCSPIDGPDELYKTSPDLIWFWLTVSGFGGWIRSGSQPVCRNHRDSFWLTLPS